MHEDLELSLQNLARLGLLADNEVGVARAVRLDTAFSRCLEVAEKLHLHIKVDDTDALPVDAFLEAGASLDHGRPGFVKYRFPGGINAILSHIKVSADELRETACNRRARPFLDHIGIDMRDDGAASRSAFDGLPALAALRRWGHSSQGGAGKAVACCHAEVAEKHWLYPDAAQGQATVPLEFAFGPLVINPDKYGCDLRPSDPRRGELPATSTCCPSQGSR